MLYVSLYIEALRSRPVLVFWLAALAQAVIWIAVPMVLYAAPPGDLPQLLAIGHEFRLDGDVGPPLAFWLGEVAFRLGGMFGVYVLSQICVVATFWCVFALGRAIVGATHAAMAVLLMAGISLFAIPTPDFGPPVLAMALWAMCLLQYWRAVMQRERRSWYGLGCAAALLLLTSDAALILLGTMVLFTAVTDRGRAALRAIDPWILAIVLVPFLFLHLLWLEGLGDSVMPVLARLRDAELAGGNTQAWLGLLTALIFAHTGLAILVLLASGWPRAFGSAAPAITRLPADPAAATFMKVFALVPALLATIVAVIIGRPLPIGGSAPLVVLSGLGIIMAVGDSVTLFHQRSLGYTWMGVLVAPALLVPAGMVLLPWTIGADLNVEQPAAAMGHFFADNFERRTGQPLAVVTGDARIAALVALAAPSRPSVYFDADPELSPWITPEDIRQRGAVVVWLTPDTTPTPPAEIKERFPDLVPEVPRTFDRLVKGRLPEFRVGWGVIRPGSVASAATP